MELEQQNKKLNTTVDGLHNKSNKVDNLKNENDSLSKSLSMYASRVSNLSKQLQEVKEYKNSESDNIKKEKQQLESDIRFMEIKIKDLENENRKLKASNIRYNNRKIQNSLTNKSLNQSVTFYNPPDYDLNKNQKRHLDNMEEKNNKLTKLLSQLKANYVELDMKYQTSSTKLQSIEGEFLLLAQKYEFLLDKYGEPGPIVYINDPSELLGGIDEDFEYNSIYI